MIKKIVGWWKGLSGYDKIDVIGLTAVALLVLLLGALGFVY